MSTRIRRQTVETRYVAISRVITVVMPSFLVSSPSLLSLAVPEDDPSLDWPKMIPDPTLFDRTMPSTRGSISKAKAVIWLQEHSVCVEFEAVTSQPLSDQASSVSSQNTQTGLPKTSGSVLRCASLTLTKPFPLKLSPFLYMEPLMILEFKMGLFLLPTLVNCWSASARSSCNFA